MESWDVVVVGGGIFGAAAARTLAGRGHAVLLIDPGPLPHPSAASTDLSKAVRADYGSDVFYAELMERALVGWRALNERWKEQLFHETGLTYLSSVPMEPGTFERASYDTLRARGHALERLNASELARRFPPWALGPYVDGYYNPEGGWAESGRVVTAFLNEAKGLLAEIRPGEDALELVTNGDRVEGVRTGRGVIHAGTVVVAAGAWTTKLVPELASALRIVGQPILCFTPSDPRMFTPPSFVPWGADLSRSGWYGFPLHSSGVVKIANHGPGVPIDAEAPRALPFDTEAKFRAFMRRSLPDLAEAPLASSRMCLYTDSIDGDLWIARHPERPGLVIATGGSGHGFKLAPLLGEIVADAVEGEPNPASARFGWRDVSARRFEEGRFVGEEER